MNTNMSTDLKGNGNNLRKEKVVLAYSGGLDTSVILKWLELTYNYEVIAVCIDVGQKEDFEAVKQKALSTGAKSAYVVNAKEEFAVSYLWKGLLAGAVYEEDYLLGTAFARPLMAKHLVEIALQEGATAIAHGATGKGNDQVRFEAGVKALAPHLKIIAPWREWALKSREDCIDFAKMHGIPIPVTKKDIYSRDENLWHISHEGGNLEDPWNAHPSEVYKWCLAPEQANETAEFVTIAFEKGLPLAVNGNTLSPAKLIEKLNQIGGEHAIGIVDLVENRLVGMKSRGVYETPGGTQLYEAHKALGKLVLDRKSMALKKQLAHQYSELVYDGLWFSPLKEAIDVFMEKLNEPMTGEVVLKLYKGSCTAVQSSSPYSLYSEAFVTFGEDDVYNQKDAEGFIQLFTLPLKLRALMEVNL